jgi:hypothetical protein
MQMDHGLAVGITDDIAAGHLVGAPGRSFNSPRVGGVGTMPRNGLRRPESNPDLCELRTMPRRVPQPSDDVIIYWVVNDFGQLGRPFLETDFAGADREMVIRNFLSGQYSNALRVVAFNTSEGWSRDVSEDIAGEVLERAFDADDNLSDSTKRFIDRHVTPGQKRPPAPSVRREGAITKKRA